MHSELPYSAILAYLDSEYLCQRHHKGMDILHRDTQRLRQQMSLGSSLGNQADQHRQFDTKLGHKLLTRHQMLRHKGLQHTLGCRWGSARLLRLLLRTSVKDFYNQDLARPGLEIVENERERRVEGTSRISFQKVIPPTLLASLIPPYSCRWTGLQSCQSSNGWQTVLFAELH